MEDWVTIRNLRKRNPDLGTRRIARLLGISRGTVRKALVSEHYPRYQRPSTVNRSIEPWEGFIKESYLVRNQKVSVIFENLRSKGFTGSRISLYRYIADHLKPEKENGRMVTYMPYETLAGEQMLYDWSEYSILFGPELVKVYVHIMELGFSRYAVLSASMTIKQSDVFEALEDSFCELGGVASRIQVDNAKVFVEDASTAHFRWNRRFLEFSGFYGIHPTRSAPGHPWSKGKVERPFAYVEDHFITNNRFDSFEDFYRKLKTFEQQMNHRVHGTTRHVPAERFAEEKEHLLELPKNTSTGEPERYVGFREQSRKVTSDCLIAYGGNRYSVPYLYAGQDVWVRVSKGTYLVVHSKVGKPVACHTLRAGRGHVVIDKEHYRGYIHHKDRESALLAGQKLKERFFTYEKIEAFLLAVKAQKGINSAYHLTMIQRLFEDYADGDCIRCMDECFRYNCFSSVFIKGFMSTRADLLLETPSGHRLEELGQFSGMDVKRPLEEYRL